MINIENDYPRPQFVRENWENLNGSWRFAFDDGDGGVRERYWERFPEGQTIQVPYSYETAASGIGDGAIHRTVWYQRTVPLPSWDRTRERLLLHFEGSDYRTSVWADGTFLGVHEGGYSRFTLDLSDAVGEGSAVLTVCVEDSLSQSQPRGKQRWKPESWGCWYTQTTGIWKTVWLEKVPRQYLRRVENTPDVQRGKLSLFAETSLTETALGNASWELETALSFEGEPVCVSRSALTVPSEALEVSVPGPLRLWSPETPDLYEVTYRLLRDGEAVDTVRSYCGFRELAVEGGRVLLNGKPLYLRMVLDQGYWQDTGLTPPDGEALRRDVELALSYGYNGVRKHQKVEDERWLYWCDVKGLLVWSEMAACYAFDEGAAERFAGEWTRVVRQNRNHPSIIAWVPFNESWGVPNIKNDPRQQALVNGVYWLTKSLDGTRPVITNDGWEHTLSDIVTIHDYRDDGEKLAANYENNAGDVLQNRKSYSWYGQLAFAEGYAYRGQPVILSEYGGIGFTSGDGWGFGEKVGDKEEFFRRLASQNGTIARIPRFSGFCYTQLTDVEQEQNGLVRMDRSPKFSPEDIARIRELNERF